MEKLVERIKTHGNVLGEGVLKVDQFLTHQVDYELMKEIGTVFAQRFQGSGITKVVTIEASGIAPALYTAEQLQVPMIFADCICLFLYQASDQPSVDFKEILIFR